MYNKNWIFVIKNQNFIIKTKDIGANKLTKYTHNNYNINNLIDYMISNSNI